MSINITAAGSAGTHTLRRVNVNTENDYIYFKNRDIPASILNGASYIFDNGVGSIGGLSNGTLLYARIDTNQVLSFHSTAAMNSRINLTSSSAGSVSLNTPTVFDNIAVVGLASPTNQAVKYFTNSTPLTGLVSGSTYFLRNVQSTFSGTTSLYSIAGNTHTFTTCGQTGRVGPTSAQISAGYSTTWHGTYLTQGAFQGYQDWTVPVSGVYEFTASDAYRDWETDRKSTRLNSSHRL